MKKVILAVILGSFFAVIYFIDPGVWAAGNDAIQPAADKAVVAVPTEEEFLKLNKEKCFKCHKKACATIDSLKQKWIVPGNPEASPYYKIIGKNRKPGTYHNLTDAEKKLVFDFIKNMKQ